VPKAATSRWRMGLQAATDLPVAVQICHGGSVLSSGSPLVFFRFRCEPADPASAHFVNLATQGRFEFESGRQIAAAHVRPDVDVGAPTVRCRTLT
jgi:hypothetical protein